MTLLSRTGYSPRRTLFLRPPLPTTVKDITVVVPVLNNAAGIGRLMQAFQGLDPLHQLPAEIILVDNGSRTGYDQFPPNLPVRLMTCARRGPANARNRGAVAARTPWLAFMDSDCVPLPWTFAGYLAALPGALAYAGHVDPLVRDAVSLYYHHQEILFPPEVATGTDAGRPDYLVTANCLVWREAFMRVGGFDGTIPIAGGEDVDLGFRLRTIGRLDYAHGSTCLHDFDADLFDFTRRFQRYGQGNRLVADRFGIELAPLPFAPVVDSPLNRELAVVQYEAMYAGYMKASPLALSATEISIIAP